MDEILGGEPVSLGQGIWQLDGKNDPDALADDVSRKLIGAGLPIYEISRSGRDLESVFREVNEAPLETGTADVEDVEGAGP